MGSGLAEASKKFKVTPNGSEQWSIDTDGKLKKTRMVFRYACRVT